MKTFKTQKRLAAQVLGVGRNKVWFDTDRLNDIQEALTKADMQELIKDNAIKAIPVIKKKRKKRIKKNRGTGKIKKKVKKKKQNYIRKIRKLRKHIKYLKINNIITRKEFYDLRRMAKAGFFRNTRHLKEYIKNVLKAFVQKTKIKTTQAKTKSKGKKKK